MLEILCKQEKLPVEVDVYKYIDNTFRHISFYEICIYMYVCICMHVYTYKYIHTLICKDVYNIYVKQTTQSF